MVGYNYVIPCFSVKKHGLGADIGLMINHRAAKASPQSPPPQASPLGTGLRGFLNVMVWASHYLAHFVKEVVNRLAHGIAIFGKFFRTVQHFARHLVGVRYRFGNGLNV